jgi:hypothetical protein
MDKWYNCPQCANLVQYGQKQCLSCGYQFTWYKAPDQLPPETPSPQNIQTPSEPTIIIKKKNPKLPIIIVIGSLLIVISCFLCMYAKSKTTITPSPYETTVTSQLLPGYSRNDPVGTDSPLLIKTGVYGVSSELNDYTVRITLVSFLRGNQAWQRILATNEFNDPPKPGFEYILAKIKFEYLTGPTFYTSYYVSTVWFDAVSSGGENYERAHVVDPDPSIATTLYPGSSHEGWIAFHVAQNDIKPLMTFGRKYDGTGGVWFKLYYGPPTIIDTTTTLNNSAATKLSNNQQPDINSQYDTYTNYQYRYSLEYPKPWWIEPLSLNSSSTIFIKSHATCPPNPFIVVHVFTNDGTLEDEVRSIHANYSDASVEEKITRDGRSALLVEHNYNNSDTVKTADDVTVHSKEMRLISGDHKYTFAFRADPSIFDKYREQCEHFLESVNVW